VHNSSQNSSQSWSDKQAIGRTSPNQEADQKAGFESTSTLAPPPLIPETGRNRSGWYNLPNISFFVHPAEAVTSLLDYIHLHTDCAKYATLHFSAVVNALPLETSDATEDATAHRVASATCAAGTRNPIPSSLTESVQSGQWDTAWKRTELFPDWRRGERLEVVRDQTRPGPLSQVAP
jgi:hypothetical protein